MDSLKQRLQQGSLWRDGRAYTPEAGGTRWLAPPVVLVPETEGGPAIRWEYPEPLDKGAIPWYERPWGIYDPTVVRSETTGMLNAFLSIPNRGVEGVEAFTKRFGVLALCEHGRPNYHEMGDRFKSRECWCLQVEHVSTWIDYARRFRAIAAIAADLHRGGRGPADEWKVLDPDGEIAVTDPIEVVWDRFAGEIDLLIWQATLRWSFAWAASGASVAVIPASKPSLSVFPVLVRELVYFVAKTEGMVFCSACGEPVLNPRRRPTEKRNAYCERCRKGNAKTRMGQRKRRARLKEASGDGAA